MPDITQDILKIVVVNRYHHASPAVGFIHGFGMKKGALASCVAHDSHNIVAVGLDDESLSLVINAIIENRGGIAAVDGEGSVMDLPLPIAGIMSGDDGPTVAHRYASLDKWVKQELGCILHAPFMSLRSTLVSESKLPLIGDLATCRSGSRGQERCSRRAAEASVARDRETNYKDLVSLRNWVLTWVCMRRCGWG